MARTGASNPKLERLALRLRRDERLPALPQILVRVTEVTRDRDSSASDLAEVILKDQALTSQILKTVNSAFYLRESGKVTTVTQAIVVLGFENVRNLTLAANSVRVLEGLGVAGLLTDFWTHSLATAVFAQMLAVRRGLAVIEEAFVAGLLHDVGKLLLARYFTEEYLEVSDAVKRGQTTYLNAERKLLGADHVEAGLLLARQWRFAPGLSSAIAAHHDLGQLDRGKSGTVPLLVYFANRLVAVLYRANIPDRAGQLDDLRLRTESLVGLTPAVIDELIGELGERVGEMADCFQVRIQSLTPQVQEPFAGADGASQAAVPSGSSAPPALTRASWEDQLYGITALLVSAEPQAVISRVLAAAVEGLGQERAWLLLRDASGRYLEIVEAAGAARPAGFCLALQPGEGFMAAPLSLGRACTTDESPVLGAERILLGQRSATALPVRQRGTAVGVLVVAHAAQAPPGGGSLQMLANFASVALDRIPQPATSDLFIR